MPLSHWIEMAQPLGYSKEACLHDLPLGPHERAAPENFPQLRSIVETMGPGDRIGLPFCLIGSLAVWTWLVKTLRPMCATIQDIETGLIFDPANQDDQAEGADHAARMMNGLKISKANEGRQDAVRKGGPNMKLMGEVKEKARLAWGTDDGRSADEVAGEFGVTAVTMWRRLTDNGQKDGNPVGRQEAIARHKQGLWIITDERERH